MENHRLARAAFFIVLSSILDNASGNKQQTQLQNLEENVLDLQAECLSIRKNLHLERIDRQNMIDLLNQTLYQCTGDCKGTGVKDKQPYVLKDSLGKALDVSDRNDSYYFEVLRRSLQAEKVKRLELENKLAVTEHKYSTLVNTVNNFEENIRRLPKHNYDIALSKLSDVETKLESKVGVLEKRFAELASKVENLTRFEDYHSAGSICGISAYEDEASDKPFVKISGGMETESSKGPWHVTLTNKLTGEVFGGGTLISKSWVVTAAHNIIEFERKFGSAFYRTNVALHLGSKVCGKGAVVRSVKSYKVHERFSIPVYFNNDIAVIKMDESVDYKNTGDIKPICLEPEGEMNRQFFDPAEKNISSKTLVFGCGYINTENNVKATMLQVVEIPIVSRAECRTGTGRGVFTENMICGGSKVAKSGDICSGDSGGGWVMRMPRSNRWVLGGIASWGVGYDCDVENFYSFYTHVAKFYNWIALNTNFLADM